jgi:hypothetical protein
VFKAALIALLLLSEQPRLSVHTYGRFAFAPADWWVRVRLKPEAEDRWLEIIADGDGQYRSTGIQLDGESSPKIHQIWLRGLSSGCYTFTATIRATGEHGRILATAKGPKLAVMGAEGGNPCGESV